MAVLKRRSWAVVLCASLGACTSQPAATPLSSAPQALHMVLGADTFVTDRYTRSANQVEGEYVDRIFSVRVQYRATLTRDARVSRLEIARSSSRAGGPPQPARAVLTFRGDTAVIEEDGRARTVAGASGAQALVGGAISLSEQLLIRARSGATDSVRIPFLEIGARRVDTVRIRWIGPDSAVATGTDARGSVWYHLSPAGLILGALLTDPAGIRIVR